MRPFLLLAAASAASPACAAEIQLKPILDGRLRYEHVDQDGLAPEADAVTLRLRPGTEIASGPFTLLAEAEGTLAINEDYDSDPNGKTALPLVGDPENIEINRLQLQFRGYHRYESDRLDQHYGNEINLLVSAKLKRFTLTAKYADYHADSSPRTPASSGCSSSAFTECCSAQNALAEKPPSSNDLPRKHGCLRLK